MNIKLRQRIRKHKISLILDIYHKGKRKLETLDLFLYPEPEKSRLTREQKNHNKENLRLAKLIRDKKSVEYQAKLYDIDDLSKRDASYIEYFKILLEKRKNSLGNYGNWDSVLKHILKFVNNEDVKFSDIDVSWILDIKYYFENKATSKHGKELSQNSKHSYFSKIKASLKQAQKEKIINENPAEQIEGIRQGEPEREFLTEEEVQEIIRHNCEIPVIKSAFLFGCFTGLRHSDIMKLKWSEIQFSKENGHYIRFQQKKTKGSETIPVNNDSIKLLGKRGNPEQKVFKDLTYSAWHNQKLKDWIKSAGIIKDVTFHCSRHTYATLLLTKGVDIMTVSKMLGHKDLKTTQVYAKIINQKKREAADSFNFNFKLDSDEN
jgi:integrase